MPTFEHKTALVVDDEPVIVELIETAMMELGFKCDRASNGYEAIQMLQVSVPAFVLTDVQMPGMNGLDLLEHVRVHYPNCFVILLTGAADVDMVVRALRAGACDFVTKPFTLVELFERVEAATQKREEYLSQQHTAVTTRQHVTYLSNQYRDLANGAYQSLNHALSAKHPETGDHSRRVAVRAMNLAGWLGLSVENVQALYAAGLLHDVGKISVDTTILDKVGNLDSSEFDQIRSHPVESARIVEPVAISKVTLLAIRHHHERYDGQGYPDKLANTNIPLGARILAVCDAYDAMTSNRTYRPALPVDEGLQRLRTGSGLQWDPEIIEAFCAMEEFTSKSDSVAVDQ